MVDVFLMVNDTKKNDDEKEVFDEAWYIARYVDVAVAVSTGHFRSGFEHYVSNGRAEGRSPCSTSQPPKPRFHLNSRDLKDKQKPEVIIQARTILVRRTNALGDVLMTTPVLARLRWLVGPNVTIDFESLTPFVFEGNPHVNLALQSRDPVPDRYELFINLDGTYESHHSLHAVDAYMMEAFGDCDWYAKDIVLIKRPLPVDIEVDWRRAVCLHPARTDRNRTILSQVWEELIERLERANLVPVILGAYREISLHRTSGAIDLTSKLTLNQTATAIQLSLCLVSADTGLSHVAGSTNTPMVTVYSAVPPNCRMPWRYGQRGWRVKSLVPDLDCVGCYGGSGCKRDDFACMEGQEAVNAEALFNAAVELIQFCGYA